MLEKTNWIPLVNSQAEPQLSWATVKLGHSQAKPHPGLIKPEQLLWLMLPQSLDDNLKSGVLGLRE